MSTVSDATKQEIQSAHGMPHSLSSQSSTGHSRSKPQACKVCGKMLSSASSYYVHMKLHSGTKPFQCTVSSALFISLFAKNEKWVSRPLIARALQNLKWI